MRLVAFTAGILWTVEFALVLFDPLGVMFIVDFTAFRSWITPAPDGYAMPAGVYHFSNWTMNVGDDGNRITPAAVPDGPRVLFYGDSVTMAWGVNDLQTWPNIVTDRLQLNGANYGRTGYSAAAIDELMQATAGASCVVFLSVQNDAAVLGDLPTNTAPGYRPMILRYVDFFRSLNGDELQDLGAYDMAMRRIAGRPNTLVLALGHDYAATAAAYGALEVPMYRARIAAADAHANPAGNLELADSITPLVERWLTGRDCAA